MTQNKTDCLKLIFGILTNHAQEMEVRSQMQYKYPFIHRCPKLTSSYEKSYWGNAKKRRHDKDKSSIFILLFKNMTIFIVRRPQYFISHTSSLNDRL